MTYTIVKRLPADPRPLRRGRLRARGRRHPHHLALPLRVAYPGPRRPADAASSRARSAARSTAWRSTASPSVEPRAQRASPSSSRPRSSGAATIHSDTRLAQLGLAPAAPGDGHRGDAERAGGRHVVVSVADQRGGGARREAQGGEGAPGGLALRLRLSRHRFRAHHGGEAARDAEALEDRRGEGDGLRGGDGEGTLLRQPGEERLDAGDQAGFRKGKLPVDLAIAGDALRGAGGVGAGLAEQLDEDRVEGVADAPGGGAAASGRGARPQASRAKLIERAMGARESTSTPSRSKRTAWSEESIDTGWWRTVASAGMTDARARGERPAPGREGRGTRHRLLARATEPGAPGRGSDVQGLLSQALGRLARETRCERAAAWTRGRSGEVVALAAFGDPPAPAAPDFALLAGLAAAADLGAPGGAEPLARFAETAGLSAAAPIPAGGETFVLLLLGGAADPPGGVRPRTLAPSPPPPHASRRLSPPRPRASASPASGPRCAASTASPPSASSSPRSCTRSGTRWSR